MALEVRFILSVISGGTGSSAYSVSPARLAVLRPNIIPWQYPQWSQCSVQEGLLENTSH